MSLSVYTRLTNLIAVRDLLTPVQAYVTLTSTLRQAIDAAEEAGTGDTSLPYLVRGDGGVVGWTQYWTIRDTLEDGPADQLDDRDRAGVKGVTLPITPSMMIAADAKLWRAAHVLMNHWDGSRFLFVLDGDEIVGTLSYRDLFKPAFRVCLFALTVELEQASLKLCLNDAAASWSALPKNRQDNATRTLIAAQKKREPRERAAERVEALKKHPDILLEHTYFSDKKTIIVERNLLPEVDPKMLAETFESLNDFRNRCAHPDSSNEPFFEEPKELLLRVLACHTLLKKIKDVIEPDSDGEVE
jgi:hypothetical protein